MKLLLIGGMPRSGTRFMANVLNNIDDYNIQGEIIGKVIEDIKSLDRKVVEWRKEYDKNMEVFDRKELVMSILPAIIKNPKSPVKIEFCSDMVQGIKHPRIERHWEWLTEIFQENKLGLIFCCRNFHEAYLSMSAHPNMRKAVQRWKNIGDPLNKWIESLQRYIDINNMKNDNQVLIPFSLSEMISSGNQQLFIYNEIVEPLMKFFDLKGISSDDISINVERNSSKELTGNERKNELAETEKRDLKQLLLNNSNYEDVLNRFNKLSGLSLRII